MGLGRRPLMALVGVWVLVFYLLAAFLSYGLLVALWRDPPSLWRGVALVVALMVLFGYLSYRFGTSEALLGLDATDLPRQQAPETHARLDRLAERMECDRPRLLVARMPVPNAFAVGGGQGAVVLDASLFRLLDGDEREALLAHELAHLEGYDGLIQTLAYTLVRTLAGLLFVFVLPVVLLVVGIARAMAWIRGRPAEWHRNPLMGVYRRIGRLIAVVLVAFTLLVRAHSRRREYRADDRAVEVTGDPLALARALAKIERATDPQYGLLSPLYVRGNDDDPLTRLLSTHPPMGDRIERLVERADRTDRGGTRRRIPIR